MFDSYSLFDDYSIIQQKYIQEKVLNFELIINQWNDFAIDKYQQQTKNFSTIINEWFDIANQQNYLPKVDEINNWKDWYSLYLDDERKHAEYGHNFNIFHFLRDEFGFNIKETMHSKLMKFLLNPLSSHGQGNKFLIDFLQILEIQNPNEGTWFVTAEEGRIDVLIKRNYPHSVIIIENKSNWAYDQPNQLYRYWYQEIYSSTRKTNSEFYEENKDRYQILYLPPNEYKQYEHQSIIKPKEMQEENLPNKIPMNIKTVYFNKEIQDWLENCKSQLPEKNHRIREYITQYQVLCNNL